jgi:hypothetical protein
MAVKWEAFTDRGNLLSTVFDSIANAVLSAATTALDNGTNLDTHCIIEINLGSLTPVTPGYIELYMTKAPDGTNYENDPVIGGVDVNTLIATIPVTAGVGAKRVMTGLIAIPPCPIKFFLGNQLNVTTAASGNTLDIYTANLVST